MAVEVVLKLMQLTARMVNQVPPHRTPKTQAPITESLKMEVIQTLQQMDNIMLRDLTTHLLEPKLMVDKVRMPMGIRIGVEIYQRLKQRNPPLKIRILMLIVLLDTMLSVSISLIQSFVGVHLLTPTPSFSQNITIILMSIVFHIRTLTWTRYIR
jgi:hypothetical protein